MKVAYPASHSYEKLDPLLLSLKIARHSPCSLCTDCFGLHPPPKVDVVFDDHTDSSLGDLGQYGSDDDDEDVSSYLKTCACGHADLEHNADESRLGHSEFVRRARRAIKLDELLQDSGRLLDFDYTDDDISNLRKEMVQAPPKLLTMLPSSSPDQIQTIPPESQSPASSELSEIPPQPSRKRGLSESSLSDPDEAEDEDEEEERPLAARIPLGARTVGRNRTGKAPSKKSKKSHVITSSNDSSTLFHPMKNGRVNGKNGHDRIKQEDKTEDIPLPRLGAAGITVDTVGRTPAVPPVKTEKPCITELRNGLIRIIPVENDRQCRSVVILTSLKTVFQKQLPEMPREYISRLVLDGNSRSIAIVKRGLKVVGGICFRPFPHRNFAEIAFFAITSADQEKGYGGMLMDHFKAHIRKVYPNMTHVLAYADNSALGYFEKQGFSKDILLDRSVWAGYIKDYEGGTIMECPMLPKIDYLEKHKVFKIQQEAIMTKIKLLSKAHIVYPGLPQFQPGNPVDIPVNPKDVPGLRETGWTPEMAAILSRRPVGDGKSHMELILNDLFAEPKGWAFHVPVDPTEVPDYFNVIKNPMDFSTIRHKLTTNQYKKLDDFVDDVNLVFQNCLSFNPETTIYAKNAKYMEQQFKNLLASYSNSKQES